MSINTWGPITWYLFHSLAEQIKDEYFIEERDNIITVFKNICRCLPCPTCKDHAQANISRANIQNIKTKEDLKRFFMEFHNIVNTRTGKAKQFTLKEITEKYKYANMNNIISQFIQIYSAKGGNPNITLVNAIPKKNALDFLIKWYSSRVHKFQHFQVKK